MNEEIKNEPACKDAVLAVIGAENQVVVPVECCGVVRHHDYVAYSQAREILAEARERAKNILSQAEVDATVAKERGFEEGLAEGRAEMFAMISSYRASLLGSIDARAEEFLALVASSAEQAIGAPLPRDFLRGLVDRAVRNFADAQRVEIYAHSKSIEDLGRAFSADDRQAVTHNIRLLSDDELREDEFRLVTCDFSISYSRPQLLASIRQALSNGVLREQMRHGSDSANE